MASSGALPITPDHHPPQPEPLTPEQFQRVRSLFDQLADLSPADRDAALLQVRVQDPIVAEAVTELLAEVETESSQGTGPPRGSSESHPIGVFARGLWSKDTEDAVPTQIGPFRIERTIGRGGMGVVYLAHQSNPDREVALKVLRDGTGTASVRSRFAREISALGRLEHAGIARLYEAGTASTAAGAIDYFAMEYVRGPRITEFAATHRLAIPDLVEILAKVADAVQHAHARGIIHRDLKPGNILIDGHQTTSADASGTGTAPGAAQPKVLDFGVARLLDQGEQHTALTEQGLLVGTVAYMSPEQLAGDPQAVDTRTDVYSLGVILFELLAERLPFDVLKTSIAEAARIIRDEEPSPLTTTRAGGAASRVDRDLQTIVAKSMAKDREARYGTAAALADDLRRYLRNEPILARRPTAAYQLSKFARRHRTLVVATIAVALAVTAGLVISVTLFLREQDARSVAAKEAELSSAVRGYMIEGLLMAAAPERMGYDVKMLDVLAHAADGLHERFIDHPEIEAEVRSDLSDVYMKLGRYPESVAHAEKAVELFRGLLGADHPRVLDGEFGLANLAGIMHEPERAMEIATESFRRARVALAEHPHSMLNAISVYGAALTRTGRYDEALAVLREGLALAETLASDERPTELSVLSILNWLAVTERAKGNDAEILPLTRQMLERTTRINGETHEDTLAMTNNLVNELLRARQFAEAATLGSTLPGLSERILAPRHPGHGYCAMTASASLRLASRFEESERFALRGHEAMVAAFDEYNWATDAAIVVLRNLYADWPGHTDQLREWTLRQARLHLMTTSTDQLDGTTKSLERICDQFRRPDFSPSPVQLLKLVWDDRDKLAPPGHPRRAVFLAAIATIAERLGSPDYIPDAIVLAQEALPNSDNPATAQALIDALQSPPTADQKR